MKRLALTIAFVALGAAACWKTKPSPFYCAEIDGGCVDLASDRNDAMPQSDLAHCATNAECTNARAPICGSDGVCVACTASTQCTPSVCDTKPADPKLGQCVECVENADCGNQICTNNACVACTKATAGSCASKLCEVDTGQCVDPNSVLYVDSMQCSNPMGTAANAYCKINDAIAHVDATKTYIHVVGHGSGSTYESATVPNSAITVTIGGDGIDTTTGTYIESATGAAVGLNSVTAAVNVAVENIALRSTNTAAVVCSSSVANVSLSVRGCLIHDGIDVGVKASGCNTTLERNHVTGNKGGVSITGGTNVVRNNFIDGNPSSSAPGLALDVSALGTFEFNSIINNQTTSMNAAGAVSCSGSQTISASIISGNHRSSATSSQIDPTCTLASKTIIDVSDSSSQGVHANPSFAADGYHLSGSAGNAMIVNQVATGPALDGDGEPRPQPTASMWDVGADEVP